MTNDEVMRKALHRAFSLGQTYWQQADSESYAANKRADVTQAKFNTLVEETLAHLSARPEPQAAVSEVEVRNMLMTALGATLAKHQVAWERLPRWPGTWTFAEELMPTIRAVLAASRHDESPALGYATRLAEAIWRKHYATDAPNWKPLPDLLGVLTQIDNMTSGLAASRQVPVGWASVRRDGMPPCDGETVYVGINTAGFSCCFNEVTHDGVCSMRGPELSTVQMSALEWWRVLDRPSPLHVGEPRQEEGERSGGVTGEFGGLDALDREVEAIRAADGVRELDGRNDG